MIRKLVGTFALAGMLASSHAQAALFITTNSFQLDDLVMDAPVAGDFSQQLLDLSLLTLSRFDPTLGTLQGAELLLSGAYDYSLAAFATDTRAEANFFPVPPFFFDERNDAYIDASLSMQLGLTLLDPAGFSGQFSLPSLSVSCIDTQMDAIGRTGCAAGDLYQGSLVRTIDLTSLGLASFTGTDPLNLAFTLRGITSGLCDYDDEGDACTLDVGMRMNGLVAMRYTYALPGDGGSGGGGGGGSGGGDPVSVPEPGTLLLLASGLLGIGFSRRLRAPAPRAGAAA